MSWAASTTDAGAAPYHLGRTETHFPRPQLPVIAVDEVGDDSDRNHVGQPVVDVVVKQAQQSGPAEKEQTRALVANGAERGCTVAAEL